MKGLKVDDLSNLSNLGGLKSNDRYSVFMASTPDVDDLSKYRWTLYVQENSSEPQPLFSSDDRPSFALDKENHLFYSTFDSKKEITHVYDYNLQQRCLDSTHQLADKHLAVQEVLSDGELLLSGRLKLHAKHNQPWHEVNEVPFWSNDEGAINGTRVHLWSYDVKFQKLTDLVPPFFNCENFWYQDQRLFVNGAVYRNVQPFQGGLYEYHFGQGKLEQLLPEGQYRVDQVAVLNDQLFAVASNGKRFGMGENPQFYQYDKHELKLVQSWDKNFGNIVVNDMDVVGGNAALVYQNKLYFYSTVVDHDDFYSFDGQNTQLEFSWSGALSAFSFHNQQLQFIADSAVEPQQLYQWHDGKAKVLSHFNRFLKDRYVAQMNQVDYQDSTGRSAHGWVLKPKGYKAGQKYPAVLEVHGGPRGTYGLSFFHEMQVLASAGYFVFFTNLHGSEGQGNEYAELRGRYGTVDYEDLMTFTDTVLQEYSDIDEQNVGVTGGSYGGFMTNWVVGHTHHFKAAVSERSIANWSSMMISDIGPEFVTDQMAAALDQPNGMERFWKQSPLRYVKNVDTPILFLHSNHDFRCPIPEGYQMFQALKLLGKTTKMVVFHGSNHDLSRNGRPDQRMHRLNEVLYWFNRYLKPSGKEDEQ